MTDNDGSIFPLLETNLESLKTFCEQQGKLSQLLFKTPTLIKKKYAYDRKRPTQEIVTYYLENPTDFPGDTFIAQFFDRSNQDKPLLEVRISALHVLEGLPIAQEQILLALKAARAV